MLRTVPCDTMAAEKGSESPTLPFQLQTMQEEGAKPGIKMEPEEPTGPESDKGRRTGEVFPPTCARLTGQGLRWAGQKPIKQESEEELTSQTVGSPVAEVP